MKTPQHTRPNSSIVFAICFCKIRLAAKILSAFLAALFVILSATPTHAATPAQKLVAAGGAHSLFVKSDGTLWAMGDNEYGQLGVSDTTNRATPVLVPTSGTVIAVAAGGYHSLFVTNDGTLWAMGLNSSGQLGDGTTTNRTSPVLVATDVIAVAAGDNYSLYVTSDGKLWAMGYNYYGALGVGTTTDCYSPVQVKDSLGKAIPNVIAVATSGDHSLFVTSDGKLWAMGGNYNGQLGDGTTNNSSTPVQVMVSSGVPATNVIAAASGGGYSLFVTNDGKLWAMGYSPYSALGVGDPNTSRIRTSPVQVATNVTAVASGGYHSLFVTSDGRLWAMGYNGDSELGVGDTNNRTWPVQVMDSSGVSATNVIAVVAGGSHSLYVTSDGKLWAMGSNYYGQLGDGTTTDRSTPVLAATGLAGAPTITITLDAQGGTGSPATQTATQNYIYGTTLPRPTRGGYAFFGWWTGPNGTGTQITATTTVPATNQTLYAKWTPYKPPSLTLPTIAAGETCNMYVTSDGNLWAFGGSFSSTPVRMASNVIAVAACRGNPYGPSLFVTSDGKLWSIDFDYSPASIGQFMPSRGVLVANVIAMAVDNADGSVPTSYLYVTSDGNLWAMGGNYYGELGVGDTTTRDSPVQVASNVIAVATKWGYSLYVTSDGKLWAMGRNSNGELGDGTTTNRTLPVQVASNVVAVAAGSNHSLYVTSDGILRAMGYNRDSELGDGTTTTRDSPVQVATDVIAVAAGARHSLYVTSDGNLWAMGFIGNSTATISTKPVQVMLSSGVPATNVIAVAAGDDYSLFVTSDGTLWAIYTYLAWPVQVAAGLAGSPSPLTINTITFDAQGGSVSSPTQIAALNYPYSTLPTPTRDGYAFLGWWTGPNGTGTQITATTTVTTAANLPLYANWTTAQLDVNKFTLSLAQIPFLLLATDTFTVTGNVAWTGQILPDSATSWLDLSPTSGDANTTTTVTLTALSVNTTGAPRFASIVVNGGGITRTLIATQATSNTPGLAPAAPLSAEATFTLTVTDTTAPGNPQTTRAYAIVTGTTLTTTDATGTVTLPYEYNATGAIGTLIIADLDSVYSLKFTNTTAGTLTLYTFDDAGPYETTGAFTYTPPPVAPVVTAVTVSPASATLQKGATQQFTATVTGSNTPAQTVTWIVAGNGSPSTTITPSGLLTIAAAETAATLTVRATSTVDTTKSGAATVTIPSSSTTGGNNGSSSSGGGGGGGGAPSLWMLAALVVLLTMRATRRR